MRFCLCEFRSSPRGWSSISVSLNSNSFCTSSPHSRRTVRRADPSGVVGTLLSLKSPVSFAFAALVGAAYATYVRVPLETRLDRIDREICSTRQDIRRMDTQLKTSVSMLVTLSVVVTLLIVAVVIRKCCLMMS